MKYTRRVCSIKKYQLCALINTMSKRINIILPDKTVAVLDRLAPQGRKNPREQLKAGYRANAERDLALAAEWSR